MSIFRSFTFWALLFAAFCLYSFHAVETSLNAPLRQEISTLQSEVGQLRRDAVEHQTGWMLAWKDVQTKLSSTIPKQAEQIKMVFASYNEVKGDAENSTTTAEATATTTKAVSQSTSGPVSDSNTSALSE